MPYAPMSSQHDVDEQMLKVRGSAVLSCVAVLTNLLCCRRGKHILMCIIKALIYLHAYNIAHLVSPPSHTGTRRRTAFLLALSSPSYCMRARGILEMVKARDQSSADTLAAVISGDGVARRSLGDCRTSSRRTCC